MDGECKLPLKLDRNYSAQREMIPRHPRRFHCGTHSSIWAGCCPLALRSVIAFVRVLPESCARDYAVELVSEDEEAKISWMPRRARKDPANG